MVFGRNGRGQSFSSFLYLTAEPVPHSLWVTFENRQAANFPTNYEYSLLVLIISNYKIVTDACFASSIVFRVVVY